MQSEHVITIDRTATPALTLTTPLNRWVAVAVRDELTIIVAGHDLKPGDLRLTRIAIPGEVFGPESPDA